MIDENGALRERSGQVDSNSRLVSFLYDLLRDHLPAGKVEELVRNAQKTPVRFTNGFIANYAEDLAKRLRGEGEQK